MKLSPHIVKWYKLSNRLKKRLKLLSHAVRMAMDTIVMVVVAAAEAAVVMIAMGVV
ncbi:hypothetical protein BLA29_015595, partial [Euroglyphus maynei]